MMCCGICGMGRFNNTERERERERVCVREMGRGKKEHERHSERKKHIKDTVLKYKDTLQHGAIENPRPYWLR